MIVRMKRPAWKGRSASIGTQGPHGPATQRRAGPLEDAGTQLERHWLRTVTVWVPAAFAALLVISLLLVDVEEGDQRGWDPDMVAHLAVLVVAIVATSMFSRFVFSKIESQEARIVYQNRNLASLQAVGRLLSESRGVDSVLPQVLDRVLEVVDAEAGEIFLVEEGSGDLVLRVQRGPHPDAFREIVRFKMGEGVPGVVAQSREPVVITDLSSEPRLVRRKLVEVGYRSLVAVPLKATDEVVGVLSVIARQVGRLGDAELRSLLDHAHQIGLAVRNAQVAEKLPAVAVLEERQRIARELHDSLAQTLAYTQMTLSTIGQRLLDGDGASELGKDLAALEDVTREAYAGVRQEIFGLRTMVSRDLGFVPTLTEYLAETSRRTNLRIDLKVSDPRATRFPLKAEVQIIRIIQEALTNVAKHARASQVWVAFDLRDGEAQVTVRDDGIGLQSLRSRTRPTFGLDTMRERAGVIGGKLDLRSPDVGGTSVELRMPLRHGEEDGG